MLQSLHIENIAVIRTLDWTPGAGLTVLTGMTGAGKSVLVDSLMFVTGGKSSKDLLRTGAETATVSAVFSAGEAVCRLAREAGIPVSEGELLLSRKLQADGKTSARVNGNPVTLAMLRTLGRALLTVHGQHDSLGMVEEAEQRAALDTYAGDGELLARYQTAYAAYAETQAQIRQLQTDEAERLRLCEIYEYQIQDIDKKKLRLDEEDLLTEERTRLRSMEKIVKNAEGSCRLLTDREEVNAAQLTTRAANAVGQLSVVLPEAREISQQLLQLSSELTDLSERIRDLIPDVEGDPAARLDQIEGRLETIARLKKKYGATVEEVLAFRAAVAEKLEAIRHADDRIQDLDADAEIQKRAAEEAARELTRVRTEAARAVAAETVKTLTFLDMPKVRFEIDVSPCELNENGADRITFFLGANVGEEMRSMSEIASGGELSRIMLSLSDVLHTAGTAETVVYDEIDTGISGVTSRKIGMKLKEGAERIQTLCVTHSAQIASLGDCHMLIYKEETDGRTQTGIRALQGEERIAEIARILGGLHVTDAQRKAAVDMLEEGKRL